ncbi:MAG: hypothetical protein HYZ84_03580 [Candidatus Omnitrophica bacterium]|nr:hypothetical protein [Candidatus Omnitrophota bacterium]
MAKRMEVELELRETQEYFFLLIQKWLHDYRAIPEFLKHSENQLLQVMADLHLHPSQGIPVPEKKE